MERDGEGTRNSLRSSGRARSRRWLVAGGWLLAVLFVFASAGTGSVAADLSGTETVEMANTGENSSRATVSPAVTGVEGTQLVLVYFESRQPERSQVTVSQLKQRARETQQQFDQYARSTPGVTVVRRFWLGNLAVVRLDHDRATPGALASVPGVEHVGPNFEIQLSKTRTTAYRPFGTDRLADSRAGRAEADPASFDRKNTTYGLRQINAPSVWRKYNATGNGVTVAVLDTGVDPTHPDITLGKWGDWYENGTRRKSEPHDYDTDRDPGGHGTHVSATVTGGNASGMHIGVAPSATLYHGAVLSSCSMFTCVGSAAQITAGMQWAVENDADVLSMSLGAHRYAPAYLDVVRDARRSDTMVVAAIGNRGTNSSDSPGNLYTTLGVGASERDGTIGAYSSGERINTTAAWGDRAPKTWPETYVVPTVAAPGTDVRSAVPGGYASKVGTSMATPHVAGGIALLQSATSENLSDNELNAALVASAQKPANSSASKNIRYGHGIIDVEAAVGLFVDSRPANFDVRLRESNAPITEGEPVELTVTIRNTGETSANRTVRLTVPALGQTESTLQLGPGENTTVSLSVPTSPGEHGNYTASVQTVDDTAQTAVRVRQLPQFAIDIRDTNTPVAPGERLAVDVAVRNSGDVSGTKTVELRAGGHTRDSQELSLSAGERTILTLAWQPTRNETGEQILTVASPDDSEKTVGTVWEPAAYEVNITEVTSPVVAGNRLRVNATVHNTGEAPATKPIRLRTNGSQRDSVPVHLTENESTTVSLDWETDRNDTGSYVAVVTAPQTTDRTNVTVDAPAYFSVDIAGTNSPVGTNETLTVNATVNNSGEQPSIQQVRLIVNDTTRDHREILLTPGETTDLTLSWQNVTGDPGEYTAVVRSKNDRRATSVQLVLNSSVLDPPPVVGDTPPKDLDGDGRYEDINGDSQFSIVDVQVFFEQYEQTVIQNNVSAFDFHSDGEISIADVQALFVALQN